MLQNTKPLLNYLTASQNTKMTFKSRYDNNNNADVSHTSIFLSERCHVIGNYLTMILISMLLLMYNILIW